MDEKEMILAAVSIAFTAVSLMGLAILTAARSELRRDRQRRRAFRARVEAAYRAEMRRRGRA
jgi:hypothetical protein